MSFLKKMFLVGFVLLLAFSVTPRLQAANEFSTASTVSYDVGADGNTSVTHEITLTNLLPDIYATGYTLSLDGYVPQDLTAWDNKGPIQTQLTPVGKGAKIDLKFNDEIVGSGSQFSFSIRYSQNDVATQKGQVWEINIPRQIDAQTADGYSLLLTVPNTFGKPAFVSPNAVKTAADRDTQTFFFDKSQIAYSRIVAAFGKFQIFDFSLTYALQNPEDSTVRTEIALPPDTAYQHVYYKDVSPKPYNVTQDPDGNWLATFVLSPKQNLAVSATGKAQIFASPQVTPDVAEGDVSKYLAPSVYWQSQDDQIQLLAKSLKTPKNIYNYVVAHLTYDFSRVQPNTERLGAKKALDNANSAICTEFTDLFIALARAAGIPARELEGYAYTTDPQLQPLSLVQDVLHAWPEYWDSQSREWIQVDPTWGNTTGGVDYFSKLDLNHFAFVIHGIDPQSPYPAGSYRLDSSPNGKNVNVRFGQFELEQIPEVTASLAPGDYVQFPFVWQTGNLVLTNHGGSAIDGVSLDTTGIQLLDHSSVSDVIPPFGFAQVAVEYQSPLFLNLTKPPTVSVSSNLVNTKLALPKENVGRSQLIGLTILITPLVSLCLVASAIFIRRHGHQG